VYISSASAYNKPAASHVITEGTTLANPYWEYSRNKIACEELLMKEYREEGFPVTIVRPSHTYCERSVPLSVHGLKGSWQVVKRMMEGKPVLVHGDGSSLWTLTWNEDFARGFIGLLGNPKAIGEAFQIMSDEQLTWNQVYECVGRALHVTPRLYHVSSDFLAAVSPKEWDFTGNLLGDKAVTVVFDCTKLKRAVPGFQATVRFDEGVRRCVDYILAHPELQVEDPDFDAWCDRVIEAQENVKQNMI
jgi:nucleoside-diphosphate-sugar epimerase